MNDKEIFVDLLTRRLIPFEIEDNNTVKITHNSNVTSRTDGYGGFYVVFEFDEEGILQKVGIWE